jgi:hypothetical protein
MTPCFLFPWVLNEFPLQMEVGARCWRGGGGWGVHCKKMLTIFLAPAGMSLVKLSLDGNKLIIPLQGEFG